MKITLKLMAAFLIYLHGSTMIAQNTDKENVLRKSNIDTLTGWKKGGIFVINLSQASLTNWAGGGENSLSVNGLSSVFLNYRQKTYFWDNSLDLGFGVLKQGKHSGTQKTDDKVDLLSQYGLKTSENWYVAGLLNFKTQMAAGYNYPNDSVKISNFFAPAYLIGAIGMDYKPKKHYSMFFAPMTLKMTFVNDQRLADIGAFGVDKAEVDQLGNITKKGKKSKLAFGGYVRMIYTRNDFKTELLKNVSITTKLDLFSNYLKNPQNIVINWENIISFRVNKFIAVNINTLLIYDDNISIQGKNSDGSVFSKGPRIQFKELLGLGMSYKF